MTWLLMHKMFVGLLAVVIVAVALVMLDWIMGE